MLIEHSICALIWFPFKEISTSNLKGNSGGFMLLLFLLPEYISGLLDSLIYKCKKVSEDKGVQ